MSIRDIKNNVKVASSCAPAVRTTGVTTGATVDLRGYDSVMVCVAFGAYTDGTHTPSLEHSLDGTTFAAVGASDLDGAFAAVSSAGGANTVQSVGYIGARRYVRAIMTVAGATNGAASYAAVIAGAAHKGPTV